MTTAAHPIWQVAIASPVYRLFDYLAPAGAGPAVPGARVRVPFGRGQRIGVIAGSTTSSTIEDARLKRVGDVLDATPLLPADLLRLLHWAAAYYHAPPGEVLLGALPGLLRQGAPARPRSLRRWRLTSVGRRIDNNSLAGSPRQQQLHRLLSAQAEGLTSAELKTAPGWQSALRALCDKGWAVGEQHAAETSESTDSPRTEAAPDLNPAQRDAVAVVDAASDRFQPFLLDGITGSGKTEVYFGIISGLLARQRQILMLVPEIGLTPQLVDRVRRRFDCPLAVLHSGLTERERLDAWLAAAAGRARIVIGTRSAVVAPLPDLGAIIVDEEHDVSYKQQEGFHYHGRDLAIMRARQLDIPVVLGSATPSLESLFNCRQGRYRRLVLPTRAGSALKPALRLIDMRADPGENGLSATLAAAIDEHLGQDAQVLLFLNRRGYAPTLLCQECGWVADCQRCDAHTILHRSRRLLRCHHCDAQTPINSHCPSCGNPDLRPLGQGTERVEEALARRFPQTDILRIDRDSTRRRGTMTTLLERIRDGRRQILVGTQMLAKGHHFPNVTLAGILDADFGLFGADFHAGERMGQLIVQVAGRAGRADKPGQVLIQTRYPEHPLFNALLEHDYQYFAERLLAERAEAAMPPSRHMALLRAESVHRTAPAEFLDGVRRRAVDIDGDDVELLGPAPAPMERRAGRWRAQLMMVARRRSPLHRLLASLTPELNAIAPAGKVRWSLDLDPVDEY